MQNVVLNQSMTLAISAAILTCGRILALCAKCIIAARYFQLSPFHDAARDFPARIHIKPLNRGSGDTHLFSAMRLIQIEMIDQPYGLIFFQTHHNRLTFAAVAACARGKCAAWGKAAYELLFSGPWHTAYLLDFFN